MATALLALACVLVRSFDWRSPALARRSDSPQNRRGDPEGGRWTPARGRRERSSDGVSRTTMLAFSALGNTDALGDDAGCHGPTSALAMTSTVTSATSPVAAHPQAVGVLLTCRPSPPAAATDKGHDRHLTRPA